MACRTEYDDVDLNVPVVSIVVVLIVVAAVVVATVVDVAPHIAAPEQEEQSLQLHP